MVKYFIIRRPFIMAREKKPVHRVQMTEGKRNRECETFSVNNVLEGLLW